MIRKLLISVLVLVVIVVAGGYLWLQSRHEPFPASGSSVAASHHDPRLTDAIRASISDQLAAYRAGHRGTAAGDTYGMQMRPMAMTSADPATEANLIEYIGTLTAGPAAATIEGDVAVVDVGLKSEGRVALKEFAQGGQPAELGHGPWAAQQGNIGSPPGA